MEINYENDIQNDVQNDIDLIDELSKEYYENNKNPNELEYLLSRTMIKNMFQFVGLCDLNGILLQANDAALKVAGIKKKDVIGKPFWDAYWWDVNEETKNQLKKSFELAKNGNPIRYDVQINAPIKNMGGLIYIDFIISPIRNSKGEIVFLVPEAIDINDKKTIELELIKTKNIAEASSRDKSIFLATMTHDLRTPLNGIKCLVDILKDEETEKKKLKHLSIIQKSTTHLAEIISKILNFSAFDNNKIIENKIQLSLKNYFEDLKDIQKPRANRKYLGFEVNVPNINILIDKFLLDQVMTNLVGNAIKFTNKGYVKIDVSYKKLKDNNCEIMIIVKDTGIGIDKRELSKIFDDFYRSTNKRNSNVPGTGLGLNICKKAVEMLNGTIDVNSKKEYGTEFIVKFNSELCDDNSEVEKEDDTFDPTFYEKYPMKILVTDDNFINRFVLKEFLKKLGYMDIDLANDGQEMVSKYVTNDYDVIFTDIRMPKLNGIDASQEIFKHPKQGKINIVAVTANSLPQDIELYKKNGIKWHVTKPIDVGELKNTIIEVYEQMI